MTISTLPRREREIFEILFNAHEATAVEVRRAMIDPPCHSAIRTTLSRLEAKGLVRRRTRNRRYGYSVVLHRRMVRETALRQLIDTFFAGSAAAGAAALLRATRSLRPEEFDELQRAIEAHRRPKASFERRRLEMPDHFDTRAERP